MGDLRESVSIREIPEGSERRRYLVPLGSSSLEISSSWSWRASCLRSGERDRERERESELEPESDRGFGLAECWSEGTLSRPEPEPEPDPVEVVPDESPYGKCCGRFTALVNCASNLFLPVVGVLADDTVPECIFFSCRFKRSLRPNESLQMAHLYGRSPVCERMCRATC